MGAVIADVRTTQHWNAGLNTVAWTTSWCAKVLRPRYAPTIGTHLTIPMTYTNPNTPAETISISIYANNNPTLW